MSANAYLLAADNSPALLPLLRENPTIASQQDDHGYSLVHAAASYNHLDLLRTLIEEFQVDVNIRDEDEETPLFVVETVDAAKLLVGLGADVTISGSEGSTARERIEAEGDFPAVAEYLKQLESGAVNDVPESNAFPPSPSQLASGIEIPPLPEGISITVRSMEEPEAVAAYIDPELKRRIEQLAERDDFHSEEGQAELRRLVEDAISDQGLAEDRNVRRRQG
jgi:uncharacterized protein